MSATTNDAAPPSSGALPPGEQAGAPGGPGSPGSAGDPSDPLGLFGRTVAGRFVVVRYLGSTSVAHIYRAVHTLMEQPCFLKISPPDPTTDDGIPLSLKREAQAVARSHHTSVLRLFDAGIKEDLAYLAQEWSDGPNLRAIMSRGADVAVPDLMDLGLQLLDSICALHRQGIVLRAFDPERILVPPVGAKPRLRLFDLSRIAFMGEALARESAKASKHPTGFRIRSTRYMAPEEIREEPAEPRSDLYSFGVLLCEMITGEYPYQPRGSGPTAYVISHLREDVRPLVFEGRPEIPDDLPGIIRRLLSKDPKDRFETAEAARRALEDIIVPDLVRLNTPSDRHVLEAWRRRVKVGLRSSVAMQVQSTPPLGLDSQDPDAD